MTKANPADKTATSTHALATPLWGRMSNLWLLMVPVCTAIYTLLLPIAPNDFWYHLRAGAHMLATRSFPTEALFSSSATPHTPYFYQSWIAEIALFQTLQSFGLSGIVILRTLVLTLSLALLQWCVWCRARRVAPQMEATKLSRLVALSTLLSFALCVSNMDIRPQTFSVPLFCLFAFALFEWKFLQPRQRFLVIGLLALLMALWANTHGAFFTGLILLAAFAAGEFSQLLLREKFKHWFGSHLTKSQMRDAVLLLVVCLLAALINPRGWGIFVYVFALAHLAAGQQFIQEWQAPTFADWYGILFFSALFLLIVLGALVALKSKRSEVGAKQEYSQLGILGFRFSELLILASLAVMAFRDARSIIWFALFCAPIFAALLCRSFARPNDQAENSNIFVESTPRGAMVANAIIALFLISSCLWFLPAFKTRLPLPPEYASHFSSTPRGEFPIGFNSDPPLLLEKNTPVKAVEFLRKNPPRAKIWNDFVFGSYLVWSTSFDARLAPHADPRVEMHDLAFWEKYGSVASGQPGSAQWLTAQGFSDVLLDAEEQPRLLKQLKNFGWRVVFPKDPKHQKSALLLRLPD